MDGLTTRRIAESNLAAVLREEMSARGWGIQRLADELGVRFGVVARWVTEDEAKRVVPQPRTLVQLAQVLDLDVIDVFRHAGYLPSVLDSIDSDEEQIQSLMRRLRRILRGVPSSQRAMAITVTVSVLDHLQVLIDRFIDRR